MTQTTDNYFTKDIDAWQEIRLGKFTASGIHDILSSGKKKNEIFGKTAMTYIYGKVAEMNTGVKPEINAKQLEWGIANEHDAVDEYIKRTGELEVQYFGIATPKYFELDERSGGSPDGLVGADGLLEMKCPYNSAYHVRNLDSDTADDLKANSPEYYTQDQFNMHILNRSWCDHVSYDPRFLDPEMQMKVIRVYRNQDHINLILERLKLAVEEVKRIMKKIGAGKNLSVAPPPTVGVTSNAETSVPMKEYKKPMPKEVPAELPDFLKL